MYMNVSEIISLARAQTGNTKTTQITDEQMLIYLNIVYDDIFSSIAETDKKLVWQQWTADTVAGQTEYTLPKENAASDFPWLKRLINVYIKYDSTEENYTKLRSLDYEDFALSNDKLAEYDDWKASWPDSWVNRAFPYPFLVRADDYSFFINPTPQESVVWGLKIQGTYTPLHLELSSQESDIKLQREYHDLIALGMEQYIWWQRQIDSKRNIAINRYIVLKQNMIKQQTNMPENAKRGTLPNLSYLS